ncbi:MAG: hypothetical protein ACOC16_00480 [Nanoarchaeota archaeon]
MKRNANSNQSLNKKQNIDKDNQVEDIIEQEPSWYHYILVILVFLCVFGILYLGYYLFIEDDTNNLENQSMLHKVPYKVGNITYNLYFESSIKNLEDMDYIIEPTRINLLNTLSFKMSFLEYNNTDNGQVSKGSTKLTSFLKYVHLQKFTQDSFVKYNVTNCSDSTIRNKIIVFNPYSDKNGVFYDQKSGCIEFLTNDPKKMIDLTDKFIYEMTLGQTNE